jgi:hypothetical protein
MALSLPLGQVGRVTISPGINFYLCEVMIALFVACQIKVIFSSFITKKRSLGVWLLFALVLYVVLQWSALTLINPNSASPRAGLYVLRFVAILLFIALMQHLKPSLPSKIHTFISVIIPTICLLQYMFFPDMRYLQAHGWDPHMFRAVGTFLDPPIAGCILLIIFYWSLTTGRIWISTILSYGAVLFLFSRITYATLLVLTPVWMIIKRTASYFLEIVRAAIFLVFTIVCIALVPRMIPEHTQLESAKITRVSTLTSRASEISMGFDAWRKSPIFGIGYGRVADFKEAMVHKYEDLYGNHSASAFHSFWVTWLATTGLIGSALLLCMTVLYVYKNPEVFFPVASVSTIGLFDNVFFHPLVVGVFAILFFTTPTKVAVRSHELQGQDLDSSHTSLSR